MAIDRRATRFGVLALVGVTLFSLLGVRLWFLQTVKADEFQESVTFAKTRTIAIAPERGRIFDADMRILADNERVLTVAIDWQVLRRKSQRDEIFQRISGWVEVPIEEMERRFDSNVYSPFLPMPIREDIDEPTAIALLERIEDFPGVEILDRLASGLSRTRRTRRTSSGTWVRSPPSSSTRSSTRAISGTSASVSSVSSSSWNRCCTAPGGTSGSRWTGRTGRSGLIEEVPPVNGFDVQLTIDLDVQQYAEQLLETTLEARRTQLAPNPTVRKPDGSLQKMDLTASGLGAVQGAGRLDRRHELRHG